VKPILLKCSVGVWLVASLFYATGALFLGIGYAGLSRVPLLGLFSLVIQIALGLVAALLLWLTHLPAPLLLIFKSTPTSIPGRLLLGNPQDSVFGYAVVVLGITSVCMCMIGVSKLTRRNDPEKRQAWSRVFILLAVLAYAFSILEMMTGVCSSIDSGSFNGTFALCQFGFYAALPTFIASTVLMIASLVLYRFVSEEPIDSVLDHDSH
jgi:hypothetical protein